MLAQLGDGLRTEGNRARAFGFRRAEDRREACRVQLSRDMDGARVQIDIVPRQPVEFGFARAQADAGALADAVISLLERPEVAAGLSEQARQTLPLRHCRIRPKDGAAL